MWGIRQAEQSLVAQIMQPLQALEITVVAFLVALAVLKAAILTASIMAMFLAHIHLALLVLQQNLLMVA